MSTFLINRGFNQDKVYIITLAMIINQGGLYYGGNFFVELYFES